MKPTPLCPSTLCGYPIYLPPLTAESMTSPLVPRLDQLQLLPQPLVVHAFNASQRLHAWAAATNLIRNDVPSTPNLSTKIQTLSSSDLEQQFLSHLSGDATYRKDVFAMAEWLNGELKQVGVETKLVDLGKHTIDGNWVSPSDFGRIGNDPTKKTVLIYGHFDVQPANKSDGWDTDPSP